MSHPFMITTPDDLNFDLFPHQRASAYGIEKLEVDKEVETAVGFVETRIGIFGDPADSGKIDTMIAVILRGGMMWNSDIPYTNEDVVESADGLMVTHIVTKFVALDCTLVLVSARRRKMWEVALNRASLRYIYIDPKKPVKEELNGYDVVLVQDNGFNKVLKAYRKYAWKRFIFDESDEVTVPRMIKPEAGFWWLVASDISKIGKVHQSCGQSCMAKLVRTRGDWTMFEETVKPVTIKTPIAAFHESIHMRPERFEHLYYQPTCTNYVSSLVEEGDIRSAIQYLGGECTSDIVETMKKRHHLSDKEKEELDVKFEERLTGLCNICLETLIEPVLEPGCQNIFCGACLLTWLKDNDGCPVCRSEVTRSKLLYIDNGTSSKAMRTRSMINVVTGIIQSDPSGNYLVAASSKSYVALMQETVRCFSNVTVVTPSSRCLMTEVTDLVIVETLSDENMTKVIGMTGGMGRVQPVRIHQLTLGQRTEFE